MGIFDFLKGESKTNKLGDTHDNTDIVSENGLNEIYYTNGTGLIKEKFFKKKGLIDGLFEEWYENGNIKRQLSYQDGNQVGKTYTYDDDGLNIEEPWTGKTYLFPPTYGRCSFAKKRGTWRWSLSAGHGAKAPSVIWFRRLFKEWKLRNIPEALFFTTYPEMIRTCPEMWDFPVCVPTNRANLIHGKDLVCLDSPISWGYFVYLPEISFGFNQTQRFKDIFSNIGKVIC